MYNKNTIHFGLAGMFLVFLALTAAWFSSYLFQRQAAVSFSDEVVQSDAFRQMLLTESTLVWISDTVAKGDLTCAESLAILYPFSQNGSLIPPKSMSQETLPAWRSSFIRMNRDGYETVLCAFKAIWNDIECFPVSTVKTSFENSWMFERTYGGVRGHEGTDLIPPDNVSGVYPVVSMTDGTVEKIGWLEQGGYRIGVRGESGGYFYYAHLDSYARDFMIGDTVYAGEQLGMMGDSGYGPEGTKGQFDVHLHLGIYIQIGQSEEVSVNPYWVLRYALLLSGADQQVSLQGQ